MNSWLEEYCNLHIIENKKEIRNQKINIIMEDKSFYER